MPSLTRRQLLVAGAVAATASLLPRPLLAAEGPSAPSGRKFRIALQLYSVRDVCKKDFDAALAQVARLGFEGVEFAGYYGYATKAADLRKRLADLGLKAAGTHIGTSSFRGDTFKKTIEFHQELGCPFLLVPHDNDFVDPEKSKAFADLMTKSAEVLKPLGMACGYHNHKVEMATQEGKTWWDLFAERTSRDVVLQQDCGWTTTAGLDPAELIKRYPGRTRIVHFKPTVIDADKGTKKPIFGQDSVKWREVVTACQEVGGTEWVTVEQEHYPDGKSPMDCSALSLAGLKALLADMKL